MHVKKAVERLVRIRKEKVKGVQVGFIAINTKGEYGGYALQKGFTYAVQSKTGVRVITSKNLY